LIVVFDSGVLISALAFGGTPFDALRAAMLLGRVTLCDQIEAEVRKSLTGRKLGWSAARADAAIAGLVEVTNQVEVTGNFHGFCRDPKDDMILECAFLASADFIVSGDRDLLDLVDFREIPILSPRVFHDLMMAKAGPDGVN
jgi:putative PIN family toxin of toxin-antitoxin system